MTDVEKTLRAICLAKGLRIADIAERMGSGQSNLISSLRGNPSLSKLEEVANAAGVSLAELLTSRPESSQGVVIIGGETYQLTRPSSRTVQLPVYTDYADMREDVLIFVHKAVEAESRASIMGMLETLEVFTLIFDPQSACFLLSICYADGQTLTFAYDKLEYCSWREDDTPETATWDLDDVCADILNAIEHSVPEKLRSL